MLVSLASWSAIAFDRPILLAALVLAGAPFVLAALAGRRGRKIAPASILAQTLAVAMLALAMAGPGVPIGRQAQLPYAVFQDVSPSVRTQSPRKLDWPPHLPRTDYFFAEDVTRAATPTASAPTPQARTNLADVLRLAAAEAPNLAGAVLVTDAQWHDDWLAAAQSLAATHLPLMIVPLESPPTDARIAGIAAARTDSRTVRVRVTVESNAPVTRRVTVTRRGLAALLLDQNLTLLPQGPATLTVTDAPGDGLAIYDANLSPGDAFPENDQASQLVLPQSTRRAFVGRDDVATLAALPNVSRLAPPPTTLEGWLDYSAVLLVDPRGDLLPAASRESLAQYVRSGGGLVVLGAGPYADPTDRDDPLNQAAALVANPYQRKPLHVVLVLDTSGSMGESSAGQTKFQRACQAALSLQKHLTPADSLTVIGYAATARVVYASADRPPNFQALDDALRAINPQGSTEVLPALDLAASPPPSRGRQGLILLVSDLLTEPYDAAKPTLVAEFDRVEKSIRDGAWKLAIVATKASLDKPPAPTALDKLAGDLGAQRVEKEGLAGLAEVFRQFLQQARGEPVASGRFDIKFLPDVPGLGTLALPAIDKYLLCGAQENASVLGVVGTDPVLAIRQVGLGRSASLALPLSADANGPLPASPEFRALTEKLLDWAQSAQDDPRFDLRITRRADQLVARIEANDAKVPMNLLGLTARVHLSGSADAVPVAMPQVAPGAYECELPAPSETAWLAVYDGPRRVARQAIESSYSREFADIGVHRDNLRKLAEITGGRVVRPAELQDLAGQMRRETLCPLWPYLLAGALLLMLIDWCGNRVLRR